MRGTSAWSFNATVISFYASHASFLQAWVAKLADATDLKSIPPFLPLWLQSLTAHFKGFTVSLKPAGRWSLVGALVLAVTITVTVTTHRLDRMLD